MDNLFLNKALKQAFSKRKITISLLSKKLKISKPEVKDILSGKKEIDEAKTARFLSWGINIRLMEARGIVEKWKRDEEEKRVKKIISSEKLDYSKYSPIFSYLINVLIDGDERSLVLTSHLLIESLLEKLICEKLPYPKEFVSLDDVNYMIKLKLAVAMGYIRNQNVRKLLIELNDLRNNFSHNLMAKISSNKTLMNEDNDLVYKFYKEKRMTESKDPKKDRMKLTRIVNALAGYLNYELRDAGEELVS